MEVTLTPPRPASRARPWWRVALRVAAVLIVFALALSLRLRATALLPPDFDEDDYLFAGQRFAQHLAAGDLAGVVEERAIFEHPPLTKLVYGLLLIGEGPQSYAEPVEWGKNATPSAPEIATQARTLRIFNALVGALTVAALAVINPLAGLLLAVNSWHIKYTSQAMLEGLPGLFAVFTLMLLRASRRNGDLPFWLAAAMLGLAAAGKYVYSIGAVGAVIWMLWRERRAQGVDRRGDGRVGRLPVDMRTALLTLAWGAVSLLVFYAANPSLWFDPLGRMRESLQYWTDYAAGAHVRSAGFGWAQPLVWMLGAVPWHPGVLPVLLDGLFALLGLLALREIWRTDRLLALWFIAGMLFLFVWQTKWPQYILPMLVPVSLMAAAWLQARGSVVSEGWRAWRRRDGWARRQERGALLWLLPTAILAAALIVYPLVVQTALSMTDFQVRHIRDGIPGLLAATAQGVLGLLPADGGGLLGFVTGYDSSGQPVLTQARAGSGPDYYGMGGIVFLLGWPDFLPILRFNVVWVVVTMALATVLGLWLASLLSRRGLRGRGLWQALFILPWAIPEFVGALTWNTLFDDAFGGINALTGGTTKWLSDPKPVLDVAGAVRPVAAQLSAWRLSPLGETLDFVAQGLTTNRPFWVMVLVGVWVAFPFMMLVSLAALRSVPAEVYDAARVDGADRWTLWRSITWPLIRPYIWSGVLLRGVLLFNAFHIALMLISDPQRVGTTTIAEVGYFVMRYDSAYSFAALLNSVVLAVAVILIWLFNRQTRVAQGVDYV